MTKPVKMTAEGYEKAQQELKSLYSEKRPKIIDELKKAYDFGDLRENSEFDAAKEAQAICDKRIHLLEKMLKNVEIVDNNGYDKVNIGSKVKIQFLADCEEEIYELVGPLETSISENKISVESPMGKALYGKRLNAIVEIDSPSGTYKVKIVKIFSTNCREES